MRSKRSACSLSCRYDLFQGHLSWLNGEFPCEVEHFPDPFETLGVIVYVVALELGYRIQPQ